MFRKCAWLVVAGLLCVACGGGIDSQEDAMEARLDIFEELNKILKDVKDKASADDAVSDIKEIGERVAKLTEQTKKLPKPADDEMEKLLEKYGKRLEELQTELFAQLPKLAQYPELSKALEDAMKGMG